MEWALQQREMKREEINDRQTLEIFVIDWGTKPTIERTGITGDIKKIHHPFHLVKGE